MTNTVLIVSCHAEDAQILTDTLRGAKDGPFLVEWVRRLSEVGDFLDRNKVDIVLVDLFLPDSRGLDTFDTLFRTVAPVPIMIVSDVADEGLAVEAVNRGAQGYVSKGYFQNNLVPQALRNVIQRKKVEEALFIEKERARVTLESIGDGIMSTDLVGNITYLNAQAERLTGWTREEAFGRPVAQILQLFDSVTREAAHNPVELVMRRAKPLGLEANTLLVRKDGVELPIEDSIAPIFDVSGKVTGAVIAFRDISQIRAMAEQMAHLAQHDYLTGLPNRMLLNDRLTQAVTFAARHLTQVAVLFLDLDKFKHINDSLGHPIGDKLLESVTRRLTGLVRQSDTVSRQGGDEFIVLLHEETHAEHAAVAAQKIIRALTQAHHIDGHELHITTSIGISLFPGDGSDAGTLIKNADTAMYHAKAKGRNNFQFYKDEMNVRAVGRQTMETELRRAIDRGEFVLYYQPKMNLRSHVVTGAEALIRWRHPTKGLVSPASFIAVAEDCGLIVPIGRLVLRKACRQARSWADLGMPPMTVAVNISALEFNHPEFLFHVRETLKETGLAAERLQIELTESVLMRSVESSMTILRKLKDMGVQLAIDDFGTGYSSLSYLNQFPIDVLKIDQSFVRHISSKASNGAIVNAVISMGASLNQTVIAEGVETQEQLDFLYAHHCDEGQGFLFGRPMPAYVFRKAMASGSSRFPA